MKTFLNFVLMPGLLTLLAGCAPKLILDQKIEYEKKKKQIIKYKYQNQHWMVQVSPNGSNQDNNPKGRC